jgi:hypothetical protein
MGNERKWDPSFGPGDNSRRPEPRPDVNGGEDPDWMFFVAADRPNLVRLKLRNGKSSYPSSIEPTTRMGCPFKPSSDCIPSDPLTRAIAHLFRPSTLSE